VEACSTTAVDEGVTLAVVRYMMIAVFERRLRSAAFGASGSTSGLPQRVQLI
jgi:hypothetical protein